MKRIRRLGPIRGVIHSAMVLDDGLIAGLTSERIEAVLAPKVAGADNLDQATRRMALDYFVLYSSVSTLIGNPGQSVYAAANGYLQGVARRRRASGLPALAIGWGPITDAGVLSRNTDVARKAQRAMGVSGMASADALEHLGHLLANASEETGEVVYCASISSAAAGSLKILQTPIFSGLFSVRGAIEGSASVDLKDLIAGKSEEEARLLLGELMATEIGQILRLSPTEIDRSRLLTELGMDSLMALELRLNVEKKFGVELPLVAITSVGSVNDLAAKIVSIIGAPQSGANEDPEHKRQRDLLQQHTGDALDDVDLAPMADMAREQQHKSGAAV